MEHEAPSDDLEGPHFAGQIPSPDRRDWRREDRERLKRARTAAQLTALVLVPLTFITAALIETRTVTVFGGAVVFCLGLAGAILIRRFINNLRAIRSLHQRSRSRRVK
jgi:peptidoglycan/LPS O-acetylase OafA/YrhL